MSLLDIKDLTIHFQTEEGDVCVFASIYEEDPLGPILLPIESDGEWDFLEGLLENLTPA